MNAVNDFPNPIPHWAIIELASLQGQQRREAGIGEQSWLIDGGRLVAVQAGEPHGQLPRRMSHVGSLWREVPDGGHQAHWAGHVFVDHRVVVEVHGHGPSLLPSDVVADGVVPPGFEYGVVVSAQERVVQPQTEAGPTQSIGPDLGVLAVDADRALAPLVSEVRGDGGVSPGEGVFSVPDHLKGLVPTVIAGHVPV